MRWDSLDVGVSDAVRVDIVTEVTRILLLVNEGPLCYKAETENITYFV
jgi:hypothetical protein